FIRRYSESVHGSFVLERVLRNEHLFYECSVQLEDLEPVVGPVRHIYEVVICDQDRVNRIIETLRRRPLNQLRTRRKLQRIVRTLSVRAPVAFVGSGVGVENDDAMVEVSIGDEKLIRFAIHEQAGGTSQVFGIVATAIFSRMPDLQEE